jgi:hypothetical protein
MPILATTLLAVQLVIYALRRGIETRSLPALARRHPRDFTFYFADPISSIVI